MKTIAIVGSRRYENKSEVVKLVRGLPAGTTVISGGCRGVDTWATETAKILGLKTKVIRPKIEKGMKRWEIVKAYHARNGLIAKEADIMKAYTAEDRKGGTENAIKHMLELNKSVETIEGYAEKTI